MSNTVFALSFDTHDAERIATFWSQALDRPLADGAGATYAAVDPVDQAVTGPRLMFHQVPEDKVVKNRLHLDILTTDLPAETARLVALGASVLTKATEGGHGWSTLADPDGNEFDLIPS